MPDDTIDQIVLRETANDVAMADLKLQSRETVLAFALGALALFFTVAGVAARLYHAQQASMAQQWYRRGNAELTGGRPAAAVEDFSNALVYSRDNDLFGLSLARAFIGAGRPEEAQAHLEELWERTPSSGIVNLELGRLAAARGDQSEAVRYYNNAIYGAWEGSTGQQQRRRSAEFELYSFLMQQGQKQQARAQLMSIAAALPADPALHVQVAKLMLTDGDFAHALDEFRTALEADRDGPAALAGAGEAAFQLGDYAMAARYLERAARNKTSDPDAPQLLATAQAALALNPFDSGIGPAENARRASNALSIAIAHVNACAAHRVTVGSVTPPVQLQDLISRATNMQAHINVPYLQRHTQEIANVMDMVASLEMGAANTCGESPGAADRALLHISRPTGGAQP